MAIDNALEDVPGVIGAKTDLGKGRTVLRVEAGVFDPAAAIAAVGKAGYGARLLTPD